MLLTARGYPPHVVNKYCDEARKLDRTQLQVIRNTRRIPFVSTLGQDSGRITQVIRKHWGILREGCPTVDKFKEFPLMAYKRSANLCDKLEKADVWHSKREVVPSFFGTPKKGNFPCLGCAAFLSTDPQAANIRSMVDILVPTGTWSIWLHVHVDSCMWVKPRWK